MTATQISAEGIVSTPLNWSGTIAAKGVLVLGGAGVGTTQTNDAMTPAGTLRTYENRTLANIVMSTTEDFGGGVLRVGTSLKACLTTGQYRTLNGRVPDYYAGEVDQVVIYNPGAAGIALTVAAEQRFRSSAVNMQGEGAHPGHGALTIPLGSVNPASYNATTAPIIARVGTGRWGALKRVSAFSAAPIVVTGGNARLDVEDSDGNSVLTGKLDLETLVAATLTDVTLVTPGDPGPPEVSLYALKGSWWDLVVELTAFVGTAGDITLELEYEL